MLPWNRQLRLGLVALALLGLPPTTVMAQGLTYGAKGGLDLTRVTFGSSFAPDTALKSGAVVGGFVTWKLVKRLDLRGEGLFTAERVPFESVIRDTFRFIDVPILVRYRVASVDGRAIHAVGGFVARYLLDAMESDGQESSSIKEGVAKSNQILTAGGSISIRPHWTADVRYLYGRKGMYKRIGGGTVGKSQSVQLTVEYGF